MGFYRELVQADGSTRRDPPLLWGAGLLAHYVGGEIETKLQVRESKKKNGECAFI